MQRAAPPRSPDIGIYRPQLTSVLSIAHRVSGAWLALGAIVLVAWLVAAAAGGTTFAAWQGFFGSWFGLLLLLAWTFALYYHLCNGIRHLGWDLDYGFELVNIYRTGWVVVFASITLTILTWLLAVLL